MTGGLALHTHGRVEGVEQIELLKVLSADEAAASHLPTQDVLLWEESPEGAVLRRDGAKPIIISDLKDPRVVRLGDVVRLRPNASLVSVLYRRTARTNVLFATERCDSLCLMCSQPPREVDDRWRIAELVRLVSLIDNDVAQLGVTGGEPTLLGEALGEVLDACRTYLPSTALQVLTNGRGLRDPKLAAYLTDRHRRQTTWAVPLYADVADIHDEVVAVEGGFEETLQGLFQLGRHDARVEVRVVLHALTAPRLPQLAAFIYRRLPFVQHIALMGLEPMGFAKSNRERLWIDPLDYRDELRAALFHLHHRGMNVSLYNLPLCVLDRDLWPLARQSISDWKNVYASICDGCVVRDHCAGFFASAGPAWRSRGVRPFSLEDFAA